MIAQLTGTLVHAGATECVLDVGGIGYRLLITPATAAGLRPGEVQRLFTTLVVREDSMTLYGFETSAERDAFEIAQQASGVGPKLALAVVSVLSPAEFRRAVQTEDVPRLRRVPGLGPKSAQKLVIELKDKVLILEDGDDEGTAPVPAEATEAWRSQVSEGLQGLGWSARDAEVACDNVAHLVAEDPEIGIAKLLRAALNSLARR